MNACSKTKTYFMALIIKMTIFCEFFAKDYFTIVKVGAGFFPAGLLALSPSCINIFAILI
jgi:hypothetical protein